MIRRLVCLLDLAIAAGIAASAYACSKSCLGGGPGTAFVVLDAVTLDPVCAAEVTPRNNILTSSGCQAVGGVGIGEDGTQVVVSAPGYQTKSQLLEPIGKNECGALSGGCNVILLEPLDGP